MAEFTDKQVWAPIGSPAQWRALAVGRLAVVAASWQQYKRELQERNQLQAFLQRLKRYSAIETGVIENLYSLSRGLTTTLVEKGINENLFDEGHISVNRRLLANYLETHLAAIDAIFELVKTQQPLTISYLHQMHQFLTEHQTHTDAIDALGQRVEIPLRRGAFKTEPNFPVREIEGRQYRYLYCPPMQVQPEMEKFVTHFNDFIISEMHPVQLAAWAHHSFTQIHPYQDGNGRMARLITSIVLIKAGYFPFTVPREARESYFEALEKADEGDKQAFVSFISTLLAKDIRNALNWEPASAASDIQQSATLLKQRLNQQHASLERQAAGNRQKLQTLFLELMKENCAMVEAEFDGYQAVQVSSLAVLPGQEQAEYYTHQIIQYAKANDYFFRRTAPRAWYSIRLVINQVSYDIIISMHHQGYNTTTVAFGGFIDVKNGQNAASPPAVAATGSAPDFTLLPIEPLSVSLLEYPEEDLRAELGAFLSDAVRVAMVLIAKDL